MGKPFKTLMDRMTPERQARIHTRAATLVREITLQELRQAQKLTQEQIASSRHMNQAAVSKMEHQSDMYISTLRRFLSAMGADLKIVATFPNGDVVINQFEDIPKGEKLGSAA